MKYHSCISLFILLIMPVLASAQLEDGFEKEYSVTGGIFPKADSISSDKVSMWPELYATYESNMSQHLSGFFRLNVIIPVGFGFKTNKTYHDTISSRKAKGFGLSLGGRYYITQAMQGFYAGPSVSYYRYNQIYTYENRIGEDEYGVNAVRGSMIIGYQHIYENGFTMHAYIGIMLEHKNYKRFVSLVETKPVGSMNLIKPDAGFSIGYYF
ncbi:MAG: DUF3575 domain-containing protein [Bacteroidota bacterium]